MWGNSELFSTWATRTHNQLIAREAADVPCGSCTACCRAGQFIHISQTEPAFEVIPADFLVAAPGRPGEFLMGHNHDGACPMLIDNQCSIYADRPQTCRTYDCRIFSAAEVYPDQTQPEIASRAREWTFSTPSQAEAEQHLAVKEAAAFLQKNAAELFGYPVNEIQISLSALKIKDLFAPRAEQQQVEADRMIAVKALLQP